MGVLNQVGDVALTGGTFGAGGFAVWRLLLWVTGRIDKRQALLDAQENALDMSWKDYRLLLEADRQEMRKRVDTVENQSRALRLAFEHVAGGLIRLDPKNPALAMAERVLKSAFGDDFTVITAQAEAALSQQQGGANG